MPLTPDDIYGRKVVNAMHVDYSRREYAWIGEVEGVKGLGVTKGRDKSGNFLRWSIDGKPMRSLESALSVLNGGKTLEAAMADDSREQKAAEQKPLKKFSLAAQIEEVERELEYRAKVYPRIVSSRAMTQSVSDMHVDRMKAVLATLRWLQANETDVRAYVAAKQVALPPNPGESTNNA